MQSASNRNSTAPSSEAVSFDDGILVPVCVVGLCSCRRMGLIEKEVVEVRLGL